MIFGYVSEKLDPADTGVAPTSFTIEPLNFFFDLRLIGGLFLRARRGVIWAEGGLVLGWASVLVMVTFRENPS